MKNLDRAWKVVAVVSVCGLIALNIGSAVYLFLVFMGDYSAVEASRVWFFPLGIMLMVVVFGSAATSALLIDKDSRVPRKQRLWWAIGCIIQPLIVIPILAYRVLNTKQETPVDGETTTE